MGEVPGVSGSPNFWVVVEDGVFSGLSTSQSSTGANLTAPSIGVGHAGGVKVSLTFPGPSHELQVHSERTGWPTSTVF